MENRVAAAGAVEKQVAAAAVEKKVHVYARVRGAIAEDGPSALAGMGLAVSRVGRSVELEGRGKFGPFSDVLGPDATQSDTFDALAPVVDAAIRYVAKTPCTLKLIAIEDALALRVQPNVPGTTTEKPNWRHRLDGDAGALLDGEAVQARLSHLGPAREGGS